MSKNRKGVAFSMRCMVQNSTPNQMVAGEIFIEYANEAFPFLLGRKGTFDREGVYLSVI